MTKQRKAAVLTFVVAIVFMVLEITLRVQTGLAGLFVAGMAGGLLVGEEIARREGP